MSDEGARTMALRERQRQSGQAILELGITLPVLLFLVLGVIELGYALYQSQLIVSLAREGSNLVSRQTTIRDAQTALQAATSGPINFGANSKVIFSVIKLGTGGANANQPIIAQQHSYGALTANSLIGNPPTSSYGGSPDFVAVDADNDASIRIGTLPAGLSLGAGESVYVTEVYTSRTSMVPVARFGLVLPDTLYASAFF